MSKRVDDWEYARLAWVEGEGYYRHEPGKQPLRPIQSLMMLEVVMQELAHDGWQHVSGEITAYPFAGPGFGPPPEDLVFRRKQGIAPAGDTFGPEE